MIGRFGRSACRRKSALLPTGPHTLFLNACLHREVFSLILDTPPSPPTTTPRRMLALGLIRHSWISYLSNFHIPPLLTLPLGIYSGQHIP